MIARSYKGERRAVAADHEAMVVIEVSGAHHKDCLLRAQELLWFVIEEGACQ